MLTKKLPKRKRGTNIRKCLGKKKKGKGKGNPCPGVIKAYHDASRDRWVIRRSSCREAYGTCKTAAEVEAKRVYAVPYVPMQPVKQLPPLVDGVMKCNQGDGEGGDCPGVISAYYDAIQDHWVIRCPIKSCHAPFGTCKTAVGAEAKGIRVVEHKPAQPVKKLPKSANEVTMCDQEDDEGERCPGEVKAYYMKRDDNWHIRCSVERCHASFGYYKTAAEAEAKGVRAHPYVPMQPVKQLPPLVDGVMKCNQGDGDGGDCPGVISAYYDAIQDHWVIRCPIKSCHAPFGTCKTAVGAEAKGIRVVEYNPYRNRNLPEPDPEIGIRKCPLIDEEGERCPGAIGVYKMGYRFAWKCCHCNKYFGTVKEGQELPPRDYLLKLYRKALERAQIREGRSRLLISSQLAENASAEDFVISPGEGDKKKKKRGYYVYLLLKSKFRKRKHSELTRETLEEDLIYIGKGLHLNRPLAHLSFAVKAEKEGFVEESEKAKAIWEELSSPGASVCIVRLFVHQNLLEKEALTKEALLIDEFGLDLLTNLVPGEQTEEIKAMSEEKRKQKAEELIEEIIASLKTLTYDLVYYWDLRSNQKFFAFPMSFDQQMLTEFVSDVEQIEEAASGAIGRRGLDASYVPESLEHDVEMSGNDSIMDVDMTGDTNEMTVDDVVLGDDLSAIGDDSDLRDGHSEIDDALADERLDMKPILKGPTTYLQW